jgi:hypothetical protein
MKLTSTHYFIILIVLVIGGIVAAKYWSGNAPGQYDAFAQCINDSGATFFGAFWCPHCAEQKRLFGTSVQYLPYHECSTPDGQSQNQSCIDVGIKTYPTWQFADGSRAEGVQPLSALAQKTGCELPAG